MKEATRQQVGRTSLLGSPVFSSYSAIPWAFRRRVVQLRQNASILEQGCAGLTTDAAAIWGSTCCFTGLLWQWLSINSVHRQIAPADSSE